MPARAGQRTEGGAAGRALVALALSALALGWPAPARAEGFLSGTILAGIEVSGNSKSVHDWSRGAVQLSDGRHVPLESWYASDWADLRVTFLTPVTPSFGILWGFGTGEAARQYRIDPSLKLGFILAHRPRANTSIALQVTGTIGGTMREKPCTADYGAIGGVQKVNCRLASTFLRPADTLDYLVEAPPDDEFEVSLTWKLKF